MPDGTDLPIPAFLEEPTEGWLAPKAKRRGDQIFTVPAVSLAECERRVEAQRQRCIAIVKKQRVTGFGYQNSTEACDAIVAALETKGEAK